MPVYNSKLLNTQNNLLFENLTEFYKKPEHFQQFLFYIHGESVVSLRIIDWFVTNYAKQYYTVYEITERSSRFKVYDEYKQKLRAYSKRRFDPFCRWERIQITDGNGNMIETTIGQMNFFKWAIENHILDYIHANYDSIEKDMVTRNSSTKHRNGSMRSDTTETTVESLDSIGADSMDSNENMLSANKTRKRRQELSVSACKCIKKETVNILVKF
jgi:hypothetical protein